MDHSRDRRQRSEGPECFEYGTYHRMYRLDGVLIAAALVTILPSYWVSEYVMWGACVHSP